MQNKSITVSVLEFITPITIFLTPLLFLPFTANFFATPQQIFIISITLILLASLTIDILFRRSFPLSLSPLRLPLILFIGIVIVGLLANPESRTESIVGAGSLYVALALFSYFVSMVPRSAKLKSNSIIAFISATSLLAIHGLLQLTLLHNWSVLPSFMQGRGFTPTGNPIITVTLLIIGVVVAFTFAQTRTSSMAKNLCIASGTVSLIATIAYLSLMLPGGLLSPLFLPLSASWSITLDSLKIPHNLFFGVGLANFSELYTSVKPIFLNTTPFWNINTSTATSELFQWIATIGLLGTASFIYLISIGIKHVTSSKSILSPLNVVFLGSALALILLPGSIPVYLFFFTSLGLIASDDSENVTVPINTRYILCLILISLIGYSDFYLIQVARAEYYLNQAKIALAKNDAKTVYESSLRAIQLVPSMTGYRLSYSQVNLSLAAALSQKSDLTDAEKQNVSQLVSQSIREGKLATSLRPHDAVVWQNLGNIYANLLTVAEGADQYAISSYAQAVALDAANPALRTEFGNLLVKLSTNVKDDKQKGVYLNRAATEFQTAIQLKSDYANAYYNFAKLLETAGDYQNAYLNMQKAVSLLEPSNPDLSKANEELNALKAKVPAPSPTSNNAPTESTQPSQDPLAPLPLTQTTTP